MEQPNNNRRIIWNKSNIDLEHTLQDQEVYVKVTALNAEEHRNTLLSICTNCDIKLK